MIRSRPVSLALVGLFVWVTACTSSKQIQLGEVADHGKVRVTTTDGERETVHDPRVEADSIKGRGKMVGGGSRDRVRVPIAIPLDQVVDLEAVGTDEIGTVLTVVGVFVGAVLVLVAVAYAAEGGEGYW